MISDDLRLHRLFPPRAPPPPPIVPTPSPALGFLKKAAVFLALDERKQRSQRVHAVSDQTDVGRVAQSDARRVDVDLHRLRLTWLRIKFEVRKAAARDDERVALFHRVLRRRGAE